VRTVGQDFALERGLLRPLPAERFPTGLELRPLTDRYARITVRQARYSVPARLIGRRVRVLLGASELKVFDGRLEVARHARSSRKFTDTLVLDHYLEVLLHKPGALPDRPRWPEPAPPAPSPVPTRRSGRCAASGSATPTAPACWSRRCCCTATSPRRRGRRTGRRHRGRGGQR